jgi:predicted permease
MNSIAQDLRYALRQLARAPGFAAVAIATLAVGVGANTALFSLANALFLRPLPGVRDDGRLVWITPVRMPSGRATQMPYPDVVDYRGATEAFAQVAAFANADFSLSGGDEPVRVIGQIVSGNYFSVLGATMERGRAFTPAEDDAKRPSPVVVISDRLWRERFGADGQIVGRRVVIDGLPFTVVGVASPRFAGAEIADREQDVWVPLAMQPRVMSDLPLDSRHAWWLTAFGQLQPDVTIEHARSVARTIASRIAAQDPGHERSSVTLSAVHGGIQPKDAAQIAPIGFLAAAATSLILLVCCANVANMLLARALGRRHEIAVRLSLGATRARLVRQLLTEAIVLAGAGSLLGLILSFWVSDSITRSILPTADVSVDAHTLLFTTAAAALTGLVFGVIPALHATRGGLAERLKDGRGSLDRGRSRIQGALVVAQVALSLVLLATSGMFLGGLVRATRAKLGFDASMRVLAASFDLGIQGYTPERAASFMTTLTRDVAGLPGVASVSATNVVPLGNRRSGTDAELDANETGTSDRLTNIDGIYDNIVRPGFFETAGIDLVAGRDFNSQDAAGAAGVVIVSEDFARQAWGAASPLGKHVRVGGKSAPSLTVIGVAHTALTFGLGERLRPIVYRSALQTTGDMNLTLLVRSRGDATTLASSIRARIRSLDADLPVYGVQSLGAYRQNRLSDLALGSILLGLIGGLSLLLATVGIYAVIAFAVGQRTREIGIRVALGAESHDVSRMFVRDGARLAGIAALIGLALTALVARTVSSAFVSVSVVSPALTLGIAALLGAVAILATWIPARRAAVVDPVIALRAE